MVGYGYLSALWDGAMSEHVGDVERSDQAVSRRSQEATNTFGASQSSHVGWRSSSLAEEMDNTHPAYTENGSNKNIGCISELIDKLFNFIDLLYIENTEIRLKLEGAHQEQQISSKREEKLISDWNAIHDALLAENARLKSELSLSRVDAADGDG